MRHENLYRRGNAWYYRFKMHGRSEPYRGSCFTHRLDEAKKVLRQKMAEAEAEPSAVTVASTRRVSLDALKAWDIGRAELKRVRTIDTTIKVYWQRLATYFEHAGEITADALGIYARRMLERGYTPQSIRKDLQAARRGYRRACELDATLPPLGTMPSLESDERGKRSGVVVSLDKVEAFLSALKGPALAQATILLMTGLRLTEFRRVQARWLKREGAAWFLCLPAEATKTKRARRIGLSQHLKTLIDLTLPFDKDYRTPWRTASKRAGLDKPMMARDLRHIYATNMAPFDLAGVKLTMGHAGGKEDAVAMLYQHADSDRLTRLAEATAETFSMALALSVFDPRGDLRGDTMGCTGGKK